MTTNVIFKKKTQNRYAIQFIFLFFHRCEIKHGRAIDQVIECIVLILPQVPVDHPESRAAQGALYIRFGQTQTVERLAADVVVRLVIFTSHYKTSFWFQKRRQPLQYFTIDLMKYKSREILKRNVSW